MSSPKLILFDAVHTLIEPHPPVALVYQLYGERQGCPLPIAELRARFSSAFAHASHYCRRDSAGRTDEAGESMFWQTVVRTVFRELQSPVVDELFADLWQHFAEARHWQVFSDVAPTFAELRRRGFQVGIASNFDDRLLQICAGHPELAASEPIFVSSRVGWVKPAVGFYREIERLTKLSPQHLWLIGDDYENDVQVPGELGWQTRWLRRSVPADPASHLSCLTDLLGQL